MSDTENFHHHAYQMACSARALDNGRFVSELTITKDVWPTRPRRIAIDGPDHETAAAAIEHARACGLKWIADYG
jgi:cytosine/adenosine deaminase-related metal-dependent hydrolase